MSMCQLQADNIIRRINRAEEHGGAIAIGGQVIKFTFGAIQVLRNADGGGGGSNFPGKSVTKV